MLEVENCPICESKELKVLKHYKYSLQENKQFEEIANNASYTEKRLWIFLKKIWMDSDPAEIGVNKCEKCGFIFTNPRFTAEEIKTKYQTISDLNSVTKGRYSRPALKTEERARRIYKLINRLKDKDLTPNKVLDYGGAEGYNLYPFIEAGNEAYIVDYVEKKDPKGLEYVGKNLSALKNSDHFDIIIFCHTLEHVIDPIEMVKSLSSHLSKDGLIFIEVPLGCLNEWKDLSEPLTHVNFFSEESLTKCLEKAGLNTLYLSTDYQWVTHSKSWCVNAVGAKSRDLRLKFYNTEQQMKRPHQIYNFKKVIDNFDYYKKRIKQKLL